MSPRTRTKLRTISDLLDNSSIGMLWKVQHASVRGDERLSDAVSLLLL
jgi:hypothetical protein